MEWVKLMNDSYRYLIKVAAVLVTAVFARSADAAGFTLYNVVPFSPGNEDVAAADANEYFERTGNDLVLYSLTLHPEGRPAIDKVRRYIDSFRRFKVKLAAAGGGRHPVRAGILVQSILGHWPRVDKDVEDWMRTVDAKGKVVRFCPIDPGFSQYIADTFTLLAKEGLTMPRGQLNDLRRRGLEELRRLRIGGEA